MTEITDRDQVLLVGLADGSLSGRRRAEAEARLREIPDGARLLERQRRVRRALRDGPAPVPRAALVASPRPRFRWAPPAILAGALAAILLALVLVQPRRSVVEQAAALAREPATAPSPASDGVRLHAAVDGVRFPDWSREFGWNEDGTRTDTLRGRATLTVFYEHMGHRIAYTILPGKPAEPPSGARLVRANGREIALYRDDGRDVAVFERDGRTCVLAGHVLRVSTLVELAAWEGDGA